MICMHNKEWNVNPLYITHYTYMYNVYNIFFKSSLFISLSPHFQPVTWSVN